MTVAVIVFFGTAIIILSIQAAKPPGWVAMGLGILGILAGLTTLL